MKMETIVNTEKSSSVYCVLCGNRNRAVSYHGFPKEENIRRKWLEFCDITENVLNSATRLCSNHFTENAKIVREDRMVLVTNAIPSIYKIKHKEKENDSRESSQESSENMEVQETDPLEFVKLEEHVDDQEIKQEIIEYVDSNDSFDDNNMNSTNETEIMHQFGQERIGLQDLLILNNKKTDVEWSLDRTQYLIDLYKIYRNKLGSVEVKTMKKLWCAMCVDINQTFNTTFAPSNVENRWRVIDRSYKKFFYTKDLETGRMRKAFPYKEAMDELYGGRPPPYNHPQNWKVNYTTHVTKEPVSTSVSTPGSSSTKAVNTPSSSKDANVSNSSINYKDNILEIKQTTKTKRKTVLQAMRDDKVKHYKRMEDIQERFNKQIIEIEKEKLEVLKMKYGLKKD